jgi:hypothetical protein
MNHHARLPSGECGDVVVVGEQDHLAGPPESGKQRDCRGGARVVEIDQEVVGDERQRLGLGRMGLDRGGA